LYCFGNLVSGIELICFTEKKVFEDIIYWNYVLFYSFDGKKELFVDDPDDHFVFVFYAIYDR
jgi:hypothetical protein